MTRSVCCITLCGHKQGKENCTFFRFPRDLQRCKRWIQIVGNEDLICLPISFLSRSRFVCSCHFNVTDYKCTQAGKRLVSTAYPIVHGAQSLSDEQVAEFITINSNVVNEAAEIPLVNTPVNTDEAPLCASRILHNEPSTSFINYNLNDNHEPVITYPEKVESNMIENTNTKRKRRPSNSTERLTIKKVAQDAGHFVRYATPLRKLKYC
ncbi:uncharacterized protein [Prorops nasuta]|uniref:uncharacterized protein n=1 Tax=Prorops nasuta TaxID=863751 RepID=UPI0034CD25FD